jgi:hypothetical protein
MTIAETETPHIRDRTIAGLQKHWNTVLACTIGRMAGIHIDEMALGLSSRRSINDLYDMYKTKQEPLVKRIEGILSIHTRILKTMMTIMSRDVNYQPLAHCKVRAC